MYHNSKKGQKKGDNTKTASQFNKDSSDIIDNLSEEELEILKILARERANSISPQKNTRRKPDK